MAGEKSALFVEGRKDSSASRQHRRVVQSWHGEHSARGYIKALKEGWQRVRRDKRWRHRNARYHRNGAAAHLRHRRRAYAASLRVSFVSL